MSKRTQKKGLRRIAEYAVFVLPVLVFLVFVELMPFINGIRYSLTDWNGLSQTSAYVGLENFFAALDPGGKFWSTLIITVRFVIVIVPVCNVSALLLANLLNNRYIKTRNFARVVLFAPSVISSVITVFLWQYTFSNTFGALSGFLHWDLLNASWLGDPKMAVISIIIVSVWSSMGYLMLIYLAGLQSIDTATIEAAIIDGVSPWQMLLFIKLPMLMGVVAVCLFISLSGTFRMFDLPWILTNGGPAGATTTISVDIFQDGFSRRSFGLGTAKSLILFAIVMIVTLLQLNITKKKEVQL